MPVHDPGLTCDLDKRVKVMVFGRANRRILLDPLAGSTLGAFCPKRVLSSGIWLHWLKTLAVSAHPRKLFSMWKLECTQ